MSIEVPELSASDFIPNRRGGQTRDIPGGTTGNLLNFIQKNDVSVEPWSAAHMSVLAMIDSLAKAAADRVAWYQEYMMKLRDNALDVWSMPEKYED